MAPKRPTRRKTGAGQTKRVAKRSRTARTCGATVKRAARAAGRKAEGAAGAERKAARARPRVRESAAERRARAGRILAALKRACPDARCALHHRSAFELLVATMLSAQCTDERVNQVTPNLFRRYPDVAALAEADQAELETLIHATGFYRAKARNLIGMSRALRDEFGGRVPDDMDALLRLPGVARKTANCVLGTWYGRQEGIVVDTHVGRLAVRLGLLSTARDDKDAVRIERDLMELFPRESWTYLAHALIQHGRTVCTARKPRCDQCALAEECPSAGRVS